MEAISDRMVSSGRLWKIDQVQAESYGRAISSMGRLEHSEWRTEHRQMSCDSGQGFGMLKKKKQGQCEQSIVNEMESKRGYG